MSCHFITWSDVQSYAWLNMCSLSLFMSALLSRGVRGGFCPAAQQTGKKVETCPNGCREAMWYVWHIQFTNLLSRHVQEKLKTGKQDHGRGPWAQKVSLPQRDIKVEQPEFKDFTIRTVQPSPRGRILLITQYCVISEVGGSGSQMRENHKSL